MKVKLVVKGTGQIFNLCTQLWGVPPVDSMIEIGDTLYRVVSYKYTTIEIKMADGKPSDWFMELDTVYIRDQLYIDN
jgi:hypothetical protein